MKKLLSVAIVLLMVLAVFVSCTETTNPTAPQGPNGTNPDNKPNNTANLDEWGREYVPSSLPADLKFNDDVVNIYLDGTGSLSYWYVEEYTDDIINDSVYDRNIKVETDLGVKLNFLTSSVGSANTAFVNEIKNIVNAETNDYDIVAGYAYFLTSGVRDYVFANLYDFEYLHLENPWWNQSYVQEAELNGLIFTITGDLSLSTTTSAGCMFFNKRLADEWYAKMAPEGMSGSDYIYNLVLDGKWTMDAFIDLVKDTYRDDDGDGVPSEGDFYAFGNWFSGPIPCDAFQYGMDASISKDDENGIPQLVFNSQRTIDALHKLYILISDCDGMLANAQAYYNNGEKEEMMREKFINGSMVFYANTLGYASAFTNMIDDFGLLPMPKFDEAQESYRTSQADGYSLIAIPSGIDEDATRSALAGATLEKLCEESYRTVNPNYFEVVMKYRYIRSDDDEDYDLKMYDIILESNKFDFGLIYSSAFDNISFTFRHLIGRDGNENFASYWGAKETVVTNRFNGLVEWFSDY